jgi:hypothetical protein
MSSAEQPWWSRRPYALLLVLLAAVPMLWPDVPPVVDLPGHIGRYAVQLASPDSPLRHFFAYRWDVIGNLGVDLLVMPLAPLIGLEPAVKLIMLLIPALTVAGMLLVAREAHGELPPTAGFALPLAYGYPFQFGFANFVLSMALALLAFALWLRLGRTERLRLRAGLFVPIGIALWFVHSFGWGVLGLLAFSAELVRRREGGLGWLGAAIGAGVAVLPIAPPLLLMLAWRSGHVAGVTRDWFNFAAKMRYLHDVLKNDGAAFDFGSMLFMLTLVGAGLFWPGLKRSLLLTIAFWILVVTYVALPRIVLGSAYADMRLAPYMLAMMILAINPVTRSPRIRGAIAIAALAFFGARMAAQTATYVRIDRIWDEQLAAVAHIPRGARVFSLVNLSCMSRPYANRMDHLSALAIGRREAFVNGQWEMPGAQLLRITYRVPGGLGGDPSQIVRPPHCRQRGTSHYPQVLAQLPRGAFDYLWLIDFPANEWPRDPGFEPVWTTTRGALYRMVPDRKIAPLTRSS